MVAAKTDTTWRNNIASFLTTMGENDSLVDVVLSLWSVGHAGFLLLHVSWIIWSVKKIAEIFSCIKTYQPLGEARNFNELELEKS